ncbi:MAG: hypothetical protein JXA97_11435 [Anaerolineales bacterium]|nr:hypothetical protein [Anaerolineales bacterium]
MKSPFNPSPRGSKSDRFFNSFADQIKLIYRLMLDPRISPVLKILPIAALVYTFLPDLVIGPFDDALVIWIGTTLFVELCPDDIVAEHRHQLRSVIEAEWRDVEPEEGPEQE